MQTAAPYARESYRFARRGFHIEYFDDGVLTAPPMAPTAGSITHQLRAVVREGGRTRFTVTQAVVGPGGRGEADPKTQGLDRALRLEVVRLIRTSEGRPGGCYRLDPLA